MDVADNLRALRQWAMSREPGSEWALHRLKSTDKGAYVSALEWWLDNSGENQPRQAFEEIRRVAPSRAAEIAMGVSPTHKRQLIVGAFAHLSSMGQIPEEGKWIQAVIEVILDPGSGWEERRRAIELLVPRDQPVRYPTRDIDEALLRLFEPQLADEGGNLTLGKACRALARRGRSECFEKMENKVAQTEDAFVSDDVLGALTHLSQFDPGKFNPRLTALLRPRLQRADGATSGVLWSIWAADLREFKPDLEAMATSGPDDYDVTASYFGIDAPPEERRHHLARQIVAIWNENDPATRTKLLSAFGFEGFDGDSSPELLSRWRQELSQAWKPLSGSEKEEVKNFVAWYRENQISEKSDFGERERKLRFWGEARGLLTEP
jgi:hypothetical protein